jgi:hypothetical protein
MQKTDSKDRLAELVNEDAAIVAAARAEGRNINAQESQRRMEISKEVDAIRKG